MSEHNDQVWSLDIQTAQFRREAAVSEMQEKERPSNIYRPDIFRDGDQWCALMGRNIEDGVAGFGPTPEQAYFAFDRAWAGSE